MDNKQELIDLFIAAIKQKRKTTNKAEPLAEAVYETLKPWLGGRGAENVGGARENQWPDNIVAHRHETTGKWVLYYLTDEQAEKCRRVLAE